MPAPVPKLSRRSVTVLPPVSLPAFPSRSEPALANTFLAKLSLSGKCHRGGSI